MFTMTYIWEASVVEELPCHCEDGNPTDPYAVVIKRSGVIVGHIQGKYPQFVPYFYGETW